MKAMFSKYMVFPVSATISPPPINEKMDKPIISGESNCTKLTPKFPIPACTPKAVPNSFFWEKQ